jgi:ribonuclease HI
MEMLLNLTPLDLLIMAEARMALYRLHILKQPADLNTEAGLLSIWKNVSDSMLDMRSDNTIPVYNYSKSFNITIHPNYWRNEDPVFPEDALIWYTDGSKTVSGTGSGIYGLRPNRSLGFSLGEFATVFQTEIYAILQCAYENIRRDYRDKRILILSDSQAALRALGSPKVISRLVSECLEALQALADLIEVTLIWVPGHQGILGNEQADKFARQASAMQPLGPEPTLLIPKCLAREAIKNWTEHQHFSTWEDKPGCRHGKLFIGKPSKKRAEVLFKLGRRQLKMAVAILTGHAPVRGHPRNMGLYDGDPSCRFCGMETETVRHLLCCC